jgi:hypothetical protein
VPALIFVTLSQNERRVKKIAVFNFHDDMPSEARIFRVSFCLTET